MINNQARPPLSPAQLPVTAHAHAPACWLSRLVAAIRWIPVGRRAGRDRIEDAAERQATVSMTAESAAANRPTKTVSTAAVLWLLETGRLLP